MDDTQKINLQAVRKQDNCLIECISGSTAYNLNLPHSDIDIKGVFVLPKSLFYGLKYTSQVNDQKNDVVFYELKRFVELLCKNNPNLLEMLSMPEDMIVYKHPLFNLIKPEYFISKLCKQTFAGYATTQIRKARGLNKKIVNPMDKERKSVLDFCYIAIGQGSMPVKKWLAKKGWRQENCALVNIANMQNLYALFYDLQSNLAYKGIVQSETGSNDVSLSSVPKNSKPETLLFFNKDGYKKYCKDYKEYWDWVNKRNEARYENTLAHGKNYDAKNMMHTFRLLDMATEIAKTGQVIVKRPNREELLKIRSGHYSYDYLVKKANEKLRDIESLYKKSYLPVKPDLDKANELLIEIREAFYKEK